MADKPKIILWDLETAPNMREAVKVWPRLGNYPGLTLKASITSIICFGYKELSSKTVKCKSVWDYPERFEKDLNDDYEVVKFAYETLQDCDAVITQNGRKFDWKFLQTRLLHHKLDPLPKILHIDTKVLASSNLYMFNNSLDIMAKFLTDTEKMDNGGWELWEKIVLHKDPKAMKTMVAYCKQDVVALEKVFLRLLPFVKNMPNYNMFRRDAAECCPNCGGFNFINNGFRTNKERRYQRILCKDCGTSFISGANTKTRVL